MMRWYGLPVSYNKADLLEWFYMNKEHIRTYKNVSLLGGDLPKCEEALRLESLFNHVRHSYFLTNSGTESHQDDRRQAAITFDLTDSAPMILHHPVEEVPYDMPILWNPQDVHSSPWGEERILFQIELEDDKPYEYYARCFEDGDLFATQG